MEIVERVCRAGGTLNLYAVGSRGTCLAVNRVRSVVDDYISGF